MDPVTQKIADYQILRVILQSYINRLANSYDSPGLTEMQQREIGAELGRARREMGIIIREIRRLQR